MSMPLSMSFSRKFCIWPMMHTRMDSFSWWVCTWLTMNNRNIFQFCLIIYVVYWYLSLDLPVLLPCFFSAVNIGQCHYLSSVKCDTLKTNKLLHSFIRSALSSPRLNSHNIRLQQKVIHKVYLIIATSPTWASHQVASQRKKNKPLLFLHFGKDSCLGANLDSTKGLKFMGPASHGNLSEDAVKLLVAFS